MRQMRGYVCKQPEVLFAQERMSLSDLQGPQRQRSVHPDNQLPAEEKTKRKPVAQADGERGGEKAVVSG